MRNKRPYVLRVIFAGVSATALFAVMALLVIYTAAAVLEVIDGLG